MRKSPFNLDERERDVYKNLIVILYFITLIVLIILQLYRQFVLRQPSEQWDDIALLITFNVLLLIGGGIFLSGHVNLKRIKMRYLVMGYAAFVLVGLLFTIFKYTVLLGQAITLQHIWNYLIIILPITAILVLGWGLLGYLGHQRMENNLK
ncbi:hypothetical protein ADN00_01835 [Ornatilinea apprima]|uniref:Uncharacterized protein n=1 Tax=Ornatilinea apprima TaxID=1134406 RepID=A0A0P6XJ97_9CHLR|nr:hypothetical protein [Ornatilinea apprima]KPL80035.1 hypothetical protein ADN00_01835 [Ornatilinea apprima]